MDETGINTREKAKGENMPECVWNETIYNRVALQSARPEIKQLNEEER